MAALRRGQPGRVDRRPRTGELYAARFGLRRRVPCAGSTVRTTTCGRPRPSAAALPARRPPSQPVLATTIGVIATDADADQGAVRQGRRHRPRRLARAIRPVHTMFDGDTLFALATGARPAPGPVEHARAARRPAADCVTRADRARLLAAETVQTPARAVAVATATRSRSAFPRCTERFPTKEGHA